MNKRGQEESEVLSLLMLHFEDKLIKKLKIPSFEEQRSQRVNKLQKAFKKIQQSRYSHTHAVALDGGRGVDVGDEC